MEPRESHDLRRFLWAEHDANGKKVLVSTIEAFFYAEQLTGLKFIYGNFERSMGSLNGERVAIHLAALEVIVAIDVCVSAWSGPRGDVLVVRIVLRFLNVSFFFFPATFLLRG